MRQDGELGGFAAYARRDDVLVFTHTQVDPAYEGQGLGSALARGALDDVRRRQLAVVPRCSFIRGWIERHADYADLVAQTS